MTVTRSAERALQHIIPWFLCSMLSACVFKPPPATGPTPPFTSRFENAPLSPVVDSGETKVFEEPGNMVVYHGFACAESNESDGQKVLRIEQSRTIPATMHEATVFLNGWHLRYLDGDHKVTGLGTAVFKIQRENNEIKWEAGGVIADDNFDDPYRWCYRYTLIAWNRGVFAATRDDRDLHAFYGDNAAGWETALSFHPTYIPSGYFTPSAAILPRGFGFFWAGGDDHNLLQLAYNLDYSEKFIAGGKRYVSGATNPDGLDRVEGNFLSWETKTIFKDNDLKRDYVSGEIVSVVAGTGVGSVQPPFTIVPHEDHANCISSGDPASATRTVERVPFPVAVPVLTGWDLRYVCDDEPVEEVGIWIESFEYTPGGYNGVLRYTVTSVLHDEDKGEDNRFRHRVSILGFDRAP